MEKLPFYFTIDLEDYTHDYSRLIGKPNPPTNENALKASYEQVKRLSEKYFNGKKITFFVTGILAETLPQFVKSIYDDGHEIGCHYYYHDLVTNSNRKDFANNLDKAIDSIGNSIGEKPLGFRAPLFAIKPSDVWAYEELAKRFEYDSSYKTTSARDKVIENGKFSFGINELQEYCIFGKPYFYNKVVVRSGGTFLRVFPSKYMIETMQDSYTNGHPPIIYMHPYELTQNGEFWMKWNEMDSLPPHKRFVKWLRQYQWLNLGHNTVENKLADICEKFEHQGPMRMLLENDDTT